MVASFGNGRSRRQPSRFATYLGSVAKTTPRETRNTNPYTAMSARKTVHRSHDDAEAMQSSYRQIFQLPRQPQPGPHTLAQTVPLLACPAVPTPAPPWVIISIGPTRTQPRQPQRGPQTLTQTVPLLACPAVPTPAPPWVFMPIEPTRTQPRQPQRGCIHQPRVSAAPPWVIMSIQSTGTLNGFNSASRAAHTAGQFAGFLKALAPKTF